MCLVLRSSWDFISHFGNNVFCEGNAYNVIYTSQYLFLVLLATYFELLTTNVQSNFHAMSIPLKYKKKTKNNFGDLHGIQHKTEVIDIKVKSEDNYISTMQSVLKTEACR